MHEAPKDPEVQEEQVSDEELAAMRKKHLQAQNYLFSITKLLFDQASLLNASLQPTNGDEELVPAPVPESILARLEAANRLDERLQTIEDLVTGWDRYEQDVERGAQLIPLLHVKTVRHEVHQARQEFRTARGIAEA